MLHGDWNIYQLIYDTFKPQVGKYSSPIKPHLGLNQSSFPHIGSLQSSTWMSQEVSKGVLSGL